VEEKFRRLVTDGISAGPAELMEQYRYQNEKVKLDYALVKPEDLEAKITPTDSEIKDAYDKRKSQYMIPEKRSVEYGWSTRSSSDKVSRFPTMSSRLSISRTFSNTRFPSGSCASTFCLNGRKTDAEVDEIKKKADDVLKQAKKGGKLTNSPRNIQKTQAPRKRAGDLAGIVQGQTVPEFERAAFSQPVGTSPILSKPNTDSTSSRCLRKRPRTPSRLKK